MVQTPSCVCRWVLLCCGQHVVYAVKERLRQVITAQDAFRMMTLPVAAPGWAGLCHQAVMTHDGCGVLPDWICHGQWLAVQT